MSQGLNTPPLRIVKELAHTISGPVTSVVFNKSIELRWSEMIAELKYVI